MGNFFTSSVGKKITMGIAGLFLSTFLLVHLGINLLLIIFDDPQKFNLAAHFMGTNIIIKIFEVILFGGFLLHIVYGIFVQIQNWLARPKGYKVVNNAQTSYFSKFMIHTAFIVGIFLVIHLMDFYFKAKFFGEVEDVVYNGKNYHDLGSLVIEKFQMAGFVIFYIASILFLGFHLLHGFQSAFRTLGLEHKTYTPVIEFTGIVYTLIIVVGFSIIPLVIYFSA
jgi:succinate dehydrogenase / fumarate reductase cytochrome b subunit